MNTEKILEDKGKQLEKDFAQLEAKRQKCLQEQGEILAEQMRLQGEFRILEQLKKEMKEPV